MLKLTGQKSELLGDGGQKWGGVYPPSPRDSQPRIDPIRQVDGTNPGQNATGQIAKM